MGKSVVSCFFETQCNYWIQYCVIYEPIEFQIPASANFANFFK